MWGSYRPRLAQRTTSTDLVKEFIRRRMSGWGRIPRCCKGRLRRWRLRRNLLSRRIRRIVLSLKRVKEKEKKKKRNSKKEKDREKGKMKA